MLFSIQIRVLFPCTDTLLLLTCLMFLANVMPLLFKLLIYFPLVQYIKLRTAFDCCCMAQTCQNGSYSLALLQCIQTLAFGSVCCFYLAASIPHCSRHDSATQ